MSLVLYLGDGIIQDKFVEVELREEDNFAFNFDFLKNIKLRDYQEQAIEFMSKRKNSILNLDIGLGKTVTSIAVALQLMKNREDYKILIICPSTLKFHWENELKTYTNEKSVAVNGVFKERLNQYEKLKMSEINFLIVNYDLVRLPRDLEVLKNIYWDVIICDELMRIKNFNTKTNRAVCQLKSNYKFGLSGALIENRLEELFSIMKYINPNVFGNWYVFMNRYCVLREIVMGNKRWREIASYKNLNEIRVILSEYMFRKNKREVLNELPERIEKLYYIEATPAQRLLYDALRREVLEILDRRMNPLEKLTYLRELLDSPLLLEEKYDLKEEGQKLEELCNIANSTSSNIIAFTQYKKFAYIIEEKLKSKISKKIILLTGDDDLEEREEKIKIFNNSVNTLLVCTEVANYGLNLQHTSPVIINLELPWSRAKLEQRIGRVERLGVKGKIVVINFITKNSVEEKVYEMIIKKQKLIEDAIGGELEDLSATSSFDMLKELLK